MKSINSDGTEELIMLCDNYLKEKGLFSRKHNFADVAQLKAILSNEATSMDEKIESIHQAIDNSSAKGDRIDGHYHQLLLFAKEMLKCRKVLCLETSLPQKQATVAPSPVLTASPEQAKGKASLSAIPKANPNLVAELEEKLKSDAVLKQASAFSNGQ